EAPSHPVVAQPRANEAASVQCRKRTAGSQIRRGVVTSLVRGDDLEGLGMEEGFDLLVLLVATVDLVAAVGDLDPADLPALVGELALELGLRLPFGLRDRLRPAG